MIGDGGEVTAPMSDRQAISSMMDLRLVGTWG